MSREFRWLRARRFQEGKEIIITPENGFANLLGVRANRRGKHQLIAQQPIRLGLRSAC